MAAEGKAIVFYRCNLFFFILSSWMTDQPWDLNHTWPVGRKWCRFTNAAKHLGRKKHQILHHFFGDFRIRHRISP